MLAQTSYERHALDFYATQERTVLSLLGVIEDDVVGYHVWEPFCGTGSFSIPLAGMARNVLSTDIHRHGDFQPDALIDFFEIKTVEEAEAARIAFDEAYETPWDKRTKQQNKILEAGGETVITMNTIAELKGFMPDAIITNPPYTGKVPDGFYTSGKNAGKPKFKTIDLAGNCARRALKLMEAQKGMVIFLCRHEWDCAKSRRDLFDHPAFAMKIVLRHRPRWIADSSGSPRFPYSYYVWNWAKPKAARPEIIYVA